MIVSGLHLTTLHTSKLSLKIERGGNMPRAMMDHGLVSRLKLVVAPGGSPC